MPAIADPDRRVVIAADMESYSKRDNVLQHRAQQGFQTIMKEAAEELGFDRVNWLIQHGGDGELAILPPDASEKAVVTGLTPVVDRLLRDYNRGLAPEARIRLRIGIHEGLVHLDGASGYPGEAVVTVCRLVDSPQLKAVLRLFPRAAVALIVSDRIYQDVVQNYHDLRPDQFLKVSARLPEKNFEALAWVYVPGENAAASADVNTEVPADMANPGALPSTGPGSEHPRPSLPTDNPGGNGGAVPYPSPSTQVYHHNTANGAAAFGNNNIVYGSGVPERDTDRRPRR